MRGSFSGVVGEADEMGFQGPPLSCNSITLFFIVMFLVVIVMVIVIVNLYSASSGEAPQRHRVKTQQNRNGVSALDTRTAQKVDKLQAIK